MVERLRYALNDSVATIVVDDGKVNVLSLPMLSDLNAALDRARADDAAVVLLSGRPRCFSAGFDLQVLQQGGEPALAMLLAGFRLSERLLSFPRPVVAACTGHAMAMGAFLLLAADVRIGAAGPFKIGANEVAIGLTMPYSALELCRYRLSTEHFTRAVITAEVYAPELAVQAGFLDRVVPPDELAAAAHATARALAGLNATAYAETKLRARAQVPRCGPRSTATRRRCALADSPRCPATRTGESCP